MVSCLTVVVVLIVQCSVALASPSLRYPLSVVAELVDQPLPHINVSDPSLVASVAAKRRDVRLVRLAGCSAFSLGSVAEFINDRPTQGNVDCTSGKYNILVDGFLSFKGSVEEFYALRQQQLTKAFALGPELVSNWENLSEMARLEAAEIIMYSRDEHRLWRTDEIIETLQWNVCHPMVASITAVASPPVAAKFHAFTKVLIDDPCGKIRVHAMTGRGDDLLVKDIFEYANEHHEGNITILPAMDVYFGSGWKDNEVPLHWFDSGMEFWAPSRWLRDGDTRSSIPCCITHNVGCYDMYMWRPPVDNDVVEQLQFMNRDAGHDYRIIWHFYSQGYRVRNPCHMLKLFHNHVCMDRKSREGIAPVNTKGRTYWCKAATTFQEECSVYSTEDKDNGPARDL